MYQKFETYRIGIAGERDSGKTTFLGDLLKTLQSKGLEVHGVISPGIYDRGQKVAIALSDLETGERKLLASLAANEEKTSLQFGDWSFYQEIRLGKSEDQ